MNHLSQEQLVLYYYGEPGETAAAVETHLAGCAACRASYAELQRLLNLVDAAPVPERGPAYAEEVWRKLEPLVGRRWRIPWRWPALIPVAALVVLAFLAGRFSQRPGPPAAAVRERILLVAVGEHLERSQMVLVELLNASPARPLDISAEQQRAADLVGENRLYRQTAARTGDTAVASVLDELERVLLEVARGPSELAPRDLDRLRRRIEDDGLLFKIRVLGSTVRRREQL